MVTHDEALEDHEKRIWKLEKWQIKIAVIVSTGAVIVTGLALWFITYSMNRIADRILGG